MSTLIPLPQWHEMHPLLIHFPIALLLLAPFFVLLGAALRNQRARMFLVSALILMVLGTTSLYLCTATGDAASRRPVSAEVSAALLDHRQLAVETRQIFTFLTVLLALLLLLTMHFHLALRELTPALPIAFLAIYCAAIVTLVSAAHHGGQLAHRFGL